MISNLEKYKKDLDSLIDRGNSLMLALSYAEGKLPFEQHIKKRLGEDKGSKLLKNLPEFTTDYQIWYSEAKALVRQLLPDRIEDFVRLYEKPKSRKEITYENYTIEDCLQGLTVHRSIGGGQRDKLAGPDAAIPRVRQQIAIVKSAKVRFESSLFDIRQLLQGDLFDSELEAGNHLLKNNFFRAAGALGGVVLEKHLGEVCSSHNVVLKKREPTISELNDALKEGGVTDMEQWRFVQRLGDLRNLCDHKKSVDPTCEQVRDLLDGVSKVIKTIF